VSWGHVSDRRWANRITVLISVALVLGAAVAVGSARSASASDHSRAGLARARTAKSPTRRAFLLGLPQRGNPGQFASQVSNPSSRTYRHFLSLSQYQSRFSASTAARQGVMRYLGSQPGVLQVQLSSDKSVILAILTAQAGQRIFCAKGDGPPTGGLCKPAAIRRWVTQISAGEVYPVGGGAQSGRGDGVQSAITATAAKSDASPACKGMRKGAFTPAQLSTAYGVDPLHTRGLTGSGVRVDTLSSQEVDASGFKTWAQCFGFRTPNVRQFAMPGAGPDTGTAPEETVLDVEALASLAPGLQQITPIYVPLDQAFPNSFLLFMFGALDPSRQGGKLPNLLSISDGVCESRFTRDQLQLGERMLAETAALGITAMAASGDLGFRGCFVNTPGALFPGSSPYVTSVGGTTLALTARNQIARQIVWSTYATNPNQGVGSGGGPSNVWARPSFQRAPGIGPKLQRGKLTRLEPDIAAMASFVPGLSVYDKQGGGWGIGGGTSAATPLEAAIVALVLQQERKAGRPPLGSLPPLLYQLARGSGYHSIFFDITKGTSSRKPKSALGKSPAGGAAQPGYDLATGLGSLKATAFAAAVAKTRPAKGP
jgi:kumamolisin